MIPGSAIPTDDILAALEIDRSDPSSGYLRALFARFNERVPFESASKILRNSEVADPSEKPRRPEVFWADHLESGAGGTCFARVAAFQALLSDLRFDCRAALGRVQEDFDHAALFVASGGEEWICDVGFPLPAVLPAREGETETELAALRIARTGRGWSVELLEGVPEGPRSLEIFETSVEARDFAAHWRRTYHPDSRFLREVALRIERPGRVLSYAAGEIRVDDRHSRARIPLPAPRSVVLEELFGVDRGLLDRAFAIRADPDPAVAAAEVVAYLETEVEASAAFAAIASPGAYARFLEGVARVASEPVGDGAWRARLSPEESGGGSPSVEEELLADPKTLRMGVRRGSRESFYEVWPRGGRTYLVRRLVLDGPRLDLLRNDSLRGRFAGSLAVDLLAWSRRLGTS